MADREHDDCDKLAIAAAQAAQEITKDHDGVVILVMVKRKDGEYCAEARARKASWQEAITAVNSWVFKRAGQVFGN